MKCLSIARRLAANCVVVHDVVYGGIRLTEDLVVKFDGYVQPVKKAAELAGPDAIVGIELAEKLVAWAEDLNKSAIEAGSVPITPDGWYQVFGPGSVVSTYSNSMLFSRELVAPRLIDMMGDGSKSLFYSYRLNGKQAMIAHDQLQTAGDDWSYVLRNPETNEFCEPDDFKPEGLQSREGAFHRVYRLGARIIVKYYDRKVEREVLAKNCPRRKRSKATDRICLRGEWRLWLCSARPSRINRQRLVFCSLGAWHEHFQRNQLIVRAMDFLIAASFTDALARLRASDQKAVKTSAFDLQTNPTHPKTRQAR